MKNLFSKLRKPSGSDPEGTLIINMRKWGNGKTDFKPTNCYTDFYIDIDDNFEGFYDYWKFATVGRIKGLSDITEIPAKVSWSEKAAVIPGYGYIGACTNKETGEITRIRIQVVDWIKNASKEIIGARVKIQSPFIPERKDQPHQSL